MRFSTTTIGKMTAILQDELVVPTLVIDVPKRAHPYRASLAMRAPAPQSAFLATARAKPSRARALLPSTSSFLVPNMSAQYDTKAFESLPPASEVQTTLSPITGQALVSRTLLSDDAVLTLVANAHAAFSSWRLVPLSERKAIIAKAVDSLVAVAGELGAEITEQMGRPVRYGKGEVAGFEERARWLLNKADAALADENVDEGRPEGLKRVIRRAPVGVTLLVGAWNVRLLLLSTLGR